MLTAATRVFVQAIERPEWKADVVLVSAVFQVHLVSRGVFVIVNNNERCVHLQLHAFRVGVR